MILRCATIVAHAVLRRRLGKSSDPTATEKDYRKVDHPLSAGTDIQQSSSSAFHPDCFCLNRKIAASNHVPADILNDPSVDVTSELGDQTPDLAQ